MMNYFLLKEIRSKTGVLHFKRWGIDTSYFGLYLHYIAKSDEDKHPHSHPWGFYSLILHGGYHEKIYDETGKFVGVAERSQITIPGLFKWLVSKLTWRSHTPEFVFSSNSKKYHQITLKKPTWTFVVRGPHNPEQWGYATEDGHIHFEKYRELKREGKWN